MKFKEGCKIFRVQFPIYFIMGVLLLSGFWIFGDDTKEILKAAFFEHFAMKSIVFILSLSMLLSGLFLLTFGTLDFQKKWHSFLYEYIIRPPVDLGIALSSVAFALSSALVFVLLIEGSFQLLPHLFLLIFSFFIIAFAYWSIAFIAVDDKIFEDIKAKRCIGVFIIICVPVLLWMTVPTLTTT
ncbi:hypothetical protein KUV44_17635 [Marinobacter daepoensis]|uniref:Yip1 domain-containing protein n=1 Tax=Marinobacter daepoensis TaxID=262077 RepID=A0ABS3BIF5_9GAMM|nr:hypothetical protein [Marinobacter daepoensis]MBN7771618.1 hypothetical protein [Marinobacter daepoensis]MBY6080966.1 hypothetical protein [Marinobacter daepoensis]